VTTFRFNEGEMEISRGWEDRTVNGLAFPVGSKQPTASFAITRDTTHGAGNSVSRYVDKQLVQLAKSCARFDLVNREDVTVDGQPAQQIDFTWRTPDGLVVHQQQTIVMLPTGVALSFTATAPKNRFKDHAARFHAFVETFKFRKDEAREE
jgi:hypothetical protein